MDGLPIKRLLYYWKYLFSWLELYVRYNWRVMDPDMHRNHFPIQLFERTYICNSKTTGRMWTFYMYILNHYSTIRCVYFLC